jgi:hypothetical protein
MIATAASDTGIACEGERPITKISKGTAKLEPPPPVSPSARPTAMPLAIMNIKSIIPSPDAFVVEYYPLSAIMNN